MGNSLASPCFTTISSNQRRYPSSSSSSSTVKLVFWNGAEKTLSGRHMAGEIMFDAPDMMVCHSDSFYIGHTIQALAIDDKLLPGQTYFVLPIDRFAFKSLTPSFLSEMSRSSSSSPSSHHRRGPGLVSFAGDPSSPPAFQYSKTSNGRVLIKVSPEFITRIITSRSNSAREDVDEGDLRHCGGGGGVCSTPELKKRYDQIVGSQQVWSPKLETISEHRVRYSPCGFLLGLEWKQLIKARNRAG